MIFSMQVAILILFLLTTTTIPKQATMPSMSLFFSIAADATAAVVMTFSHFLLSETSSKEASSDIQGKPSEVKRSPELSVVSEDAPRELSQEQKREMH